MSASSRRSAAPMGVSPGELAHYDNPLMAPTSGRAARVGGCLAGVTVIFAVEIPLSTAREN